MKKIKKSRKYENIHFDSCSKYFSSETPYEKDKKNEKDEKLILINV